MGITQPAACEKSTVLVPVIFFCTNDQSDFSSPSATVIGELRRNERDASATNVKQRGARWQERRPAGDGGSWKASGRSARDRPIAVTFQSREPLILRI